MYMNLGSDSGIPTVNTFSGGSAIPMGLTRTIVFAIKIA